MALHYLSGDEFGCTIIGLDQFGSAQFGNKAARQAKRAEKKQNRVEKRQEKREERAGKNKQPQASSPATPPPSPPPPPKPKLTINTTLPDTMTMAPTKAAQKVSTAITNLKIDENQQRTGRFVDAETQKQLDADFDANDPRRQPQESMMESGGGMGDMLKNPVVLGGLALVAFLAFRNQ